MSKMRALTSLSAAQISIPQGHRWTKYGTICFVFGLLGLAASMGLGLNKSKHHAADAHAVPAEAGASHATATAAQGDASATSEHATHHGPPERGIFSAQFSFSYLVAYVFWLSIALGGLFFVLVQFAARAGWSVVVRRVAEFAMVALPAFIVLFIPVYLGMSDLYYHWYDPAQHDEVLQHKASYLNPGSFIARAGIYFVVWFVTSLWFYRKSIAQDDTGDKGLTRRMQVASGPALIMFAFSSTFAAFDWVMSLEPHWFSTMFGVYFFSGCVVGIFALLSILIVTMRRAGLVGNLINEEHFHDLGKLLFAFTVFWAYIAFSQYMLIWYANLPEETIWFEMRGQGGWKTLSLLLAVGHFAVPFFFLMSRHVKRAGFLLVLGAYWLLVMHYVDLYWIVMPTLHKGDTHFSVLDLLTFLGVGGVTLGILFTAMKRRPLIPRQDPRLAESVAFENF
jgi:hypothetical protein